MQNSLAMLSRYFVGGSTMIQTLTRVCEAARAAIDPSAIVGLTMAVDGRRGGRTYTHACTVADLVAIEERQFEASDGPCWDAFATGDRVYVPAIESHGPYLEFRAAAALNQIGSVLSVPLSFETAPIGALTLYARREQAFSDRHTELLEAFAAPASYVLVNTRAYWDARILSENLEQAMASRAEIEQAKGIIMATTGVDADQAYEELRRQSQYENVKVRVIAGELVRRAQGHRQHPIDSPHS